MKSKILIMVLLTALLLTFGCSKAEYSGFTDGYSQNAVQEYAAFRDMSDLYDYSFPITIKQGTPGLAYDDSATTRWEGTGFDSAPAPAFRDMSNLYGRAEQESAGDSMSADLDNVERKLVKSANIRIRVENLNVAEAFVAELMEKYNSYAASTNVQENAYHYSMRVPSQAYDVFLAEMNGMGRLISRTERTEDVTLRYYDLEGRLETKKELLRTFQSYLRRAGNIEEILAVEARISELQYDIEGTGKQLRDLANRIDYAVIDLTILGPAAASSNRSVTFGERIGQMFGGFGRFLSSTVMVIIGIVIYGIPILLLLALFFWLFFGKIGLMKKLWLIVKGKKLG